MNPVTKIAKTKPRVLKGGFRLNFAVNPQRRESESFSKICKNENLGWQEVFRRIPKEFCCKIVSEEVDCQNKELIKEARLSFVSGHTSTSFYSATFLASFIKS